MFSQSPDASPWEINAVSVGTALVPFLSATLMQGLLLDPVNPNPTIAIGADSLYLMRLAPLFFQDANRGWWPYSVTMHAMTDFLSNLFLWAFKAGVPRSEVGSRAPFTLPAFPFSQGMRLGPL